MSPVPRAVVAASTRRSGAADVGIPSDSNYLDSLPEETRRKAVYAQQMREKNSNTATAIEQMGAGVEISSARIDHLIQSLVDLGIVTEEQRWEEEAEWQKHLNVQLRDYHQRVTEMRQAAKAQAKRPQLILPPHVKG